MRNSIRPHKVGWQQDAQLPHRELFLKGHGKRRGGIHGAIRAARKILLHGCVSGRSLGTGFEKILKKRGHEVLVALRQWTPCLPRPKRILPQISAESRPSRWECASLSNFLNKFVEIHKKKTRVILITRLLIFSRPSIAQFKSFRAESPFLFLFEDGTDQRTEAAKGPPQYPLQGRNSWAAQQCQAQCLPSRKSMSTACGPVQKEGAGTHQPHEIMGQLVPLFFDLFVYALVAPVLVGSKAGDALKQVERLNVRLARLERQYSEQLGQIRAAARNPAT